MSLLFEQVMQAEAVGCEDWMLPLDRHGFLEECYFSFSYSPIRDESGVGGVNVTITETTARVLMLLLGSMQAEERLAPFCSIFPAPFCARIFADLLQPAHD